jgi:hypothetical protein
MECKRANRALQWTAKEHIRIVERSVEEYEEHKQIKRSTKAHKGA